MDGHLPLSFLMSTSVLVIFVHCCREGLEHLQITTKYYLSLFIPNCSPRGETTSYEQIFKMSAPNATSSPKSGQENSGRNSGGVSPPIHGPLEADVSLLLSDHGTFKRLYFRCE